MVGLQSLPLMYRQRNLKNCIANTASKPLTIPPLSDRLGYGNHNTNYSINRTTWSIGRITMSKTKNLYTILAEWYPDGDYTESQLWEAIAEADGYERDYYEDGDLTEWL